MPVDGDIPAPVPECRRCRCNQPASARQIVLVKPDGSDGKRCGPYCDEHVDALIGNLTPTYTGGGAAYRIDRSDAAVTCG